MTDPIRVLLADDEELVRAGLMDILAGRSDYEIVASCSDGDKALIGLLKERPDLAFIDIKMPGRDGFSVIEAVPTALRPVVVFVTAFDRYALKAFEVHAVDYLLKPFDSVRFETALQRATERVRARAISPCRPPGLFMARSARGRVEIINPSEIRWIEAADNYVTLHTASGSHLVRGTLREMLERLDRFVRTHRSALVNLDLVQAIEPAGHDFAVCLRGGGKVRLSRTHRDALLERLQATH